MLEEKGCKTKRGNSNWYVPLVKKILKQEMYTGVRYYNQLKIEPIATNKHKMKKRPREDWVGVKVPQIIDENKFKEVQEKFKWNKSRYRNPFKTQLLSSIIYCGYCEYKAYAYRRYYRDRRHAELRLYLVEMYRCHYKERLKKMHSTNTNRITCPNKEMRAFILEDHVFKIMYKFMRDADELSKHMDFFKRQSQREFEKVTKELEMLDNKIEKENISKKILLSKYVEQSISTDD